jgi:septum site-determining protein MinC
MPMSVVTQASGPASFEIKSANLPLVSLLLKSTDLATLSRELGLRFGEMADFFDQDPLLVDLSHLAREAAAAGMDFPGLIALLREYRLVPIAAKGGSPEQMAAALAGGLVAAPDAHVLGNKARPSDGHPPVAHQAVHAPAPAQQTQQQMQAAIAQGALIIDKPLRSGQQVYARGRDLVVLAMVNAGAEVIADGHIHVYAPLRGKAMAGARGNSDARIFSIALDAELLSIAGVYRTSETPLPANVKGRPSQVRLVSSAEGDKLVMDGLA